MGYLKILEIMKKAILVLLSLFFILQAQSQITVKYSVGYGSYKMSDMKDLLSGTRNAILAKVPGLDISTTDNFPGYIMHTFDLGYRMQKHEFGITVSYLNTAGKISYADYSGKISSEIKVSGYRGGIFYRNYFYSISMGENQSMSFYGEISPSLIFSKIKIDQEVFPKNNILELEDNSYNNTSVSLLPQLGVKYNFTSHIGLFVSTGYEINFSSKISEIESEIDWSGLRVNGGISYSF
ncbi:outer membrane protein with beta-barrel domain [Dysgonomonas alginatilytica]|uniref:Outer membrane protein with beta-barrel domain n=2 Tax=Dysgonomonas alginatilytica TaxID=1605892 RepID=A0A2V3PTH7_9BACT|nr:outer membrane protein with beta-barrel domain [Dysgonomonas alginatilytica]